MTATADEQLSHAGPGELADRVRTKQVSPRELMELFLRRTEDRNPRLNAFRTVFAERALAEADAQTNLDGPLAGVPIAIKDDMALAGEPTTRGSRTFGPPAPVDAEALRRLRCAGAIPIGITNVPELTIWPWTITEANGVTRNPWELARTPGGSSGGSAAAVASGMVPCATGSDGGGSIRIPAACCGLVGMKPTRGRVSMAPLREGWLGLSVFGGLARTVRDSALLLDVMQGAVAGDAHSAPAPEGKFLEATVTPPRRLRIAVSRKVPPGLIAWVSSDQRAAWEATGRLLAELGHEVVQRDPRYGMAQLEFVQTWMRGIYEESCTLPDPTRLERLSRQVASAGKRLVPPNRRDKLLARRSATTARILALWDDIDVLVTPGLATTAIAAEGGFGKAMPLALDQAARFTPFTAIFNLTGQPAVTIPAGFGGDGLPLSVQLVGRLGAERTLYSLAGQLEQSRPWGEKWPTV
jgi:amidase